MDYPRYSIEELEMMLKKAYLTQEREFRLNAGNVARHTLERLDSFIAAVDGQRLTYKRLTA